MIDTLVAAFTDYGMVGLVILYFMFKDAVKSGILKQTVVLKGDGRVANFIDGKNDTGKNSDSGVGDSYNG